MQICRTPNTANKTNFGNRRTDKTMNNKCNTCAKQFTCSRKECKKVTFVQAKILEKPRKEKEYGRCKKKHNWIIQRVRRSGN